MRHLYPLLLAAICLGFPASSSAAVNITGAPYVDVDGYRIHTVTGSSTLTVTSGGKVDYLLVGGGGGGGRLVDPATGVGYGGGGAGGQVLSGDFMSSPGNFSVFAGAGGGEGINGSPSSIVGVAESTGGPAASSHSGASLGASAGGLGSFDAAGGGSGAGGAGSTANPYLAALGPPPSSAGTGATSGVAPSNTTAPTIATSLSGAPQLWAKPGTASALSGGGVGILPDLSGSGNDFLRGSANRNYSQEVLADSPTAFYKLGETSGTSYADSSGNGYGLTGPSAASTNAVGPSAAASDRALGVNGSTTNGLDRTQPVQTITSTWSMEAWVYPLTTSQRGLIMINGHSGLSGYALTLTSPDGVSNGNCLTALFGNVAYINSGWCNFVANTWYHVAATRDGTTTRFYVNGTQVGNTSTSGVNGIDPANSYFRVGSITNLPFNGRIAYAAIYNRQLSESRLAQHYAAASRPQFVSSGLGSRPALRFDGVNDYLDAPGSYSTPLSVFAVASKDAAGSGWERLLSAQQDSRLSFGAVAGDFASFTGNGSAWNDSSANTPSRSITSSGSIMAFTTDGTTLRPFLNGEAQSTKNGAMSSFTGLRLGANQPTSNNWNGELSELIVFPSVLSSLDRQRVEGYLAWQYGLQASLPPGHPFRSDPTRASDFRSGHTLLADTGVWDHRSTPASLTHSWYRCDSAQAAPGSSLPSGCSLMGSAGPLYTVVSGDVDKHLLYRATSTNASGSSSSYSASATPAWAGGIGGAGGDGVASSFSGAAKTYGAGGGGSGLFAGGAGAGAGGWGSNSGLSAPAGSGGGGGGAGASASAAGSGGSGVAILRYPLAPAQPVKSSGPAATQDNTPSFSWASDSWASDKCRLDSISTASSGVFEACTTGAYTSGSLADGEYRLRVISVGRESIESQPLDISFRVDTTPPVATWESLQSASGAALPTFRLNLSEPTSSLTPADLINAGSARRCRFSLVRLSDSAWRVTPWGCTSGTVRPRLASASLTDEVGNAGPLTFSEASDFNLDTVKPEVSGWTSPSAPSRLNLSFTLNFSESIQGLSASDFSLSGSAQGCQVAPSSSSGRNIQVIVSSCSSSGSVFLKLKTNSVSDLSGNPGPTSSPASGAGQIDLTPPSLSIAPPSLMSRSAPASFVLRFSEPISGLGAAGLTYAGTASGCSLNPGLSAGRTIPVSVSGCSAGTFKLTVLPSQVEDGVGNPGPTVRISSAKLTIAN